MLKIEDLQVEVEGKQILDRFSLEVNAGEIHAIMGPNGSGKSTLCYSLMGHPRYRITGGRVKFLGRDLLEMKTDERARLGIFLGFQYPREVGGITFGNFLRQASNLRAKADDVNAKAVGAGEYFKIAGELLKKVDLDKKFIGRGVNEGFSGGEKKRAEIVQMAALRPKLAILDEIDSGLDIDSMKITAGAIGEVLRETKMGMILITHYQRLLQYLPADHVHIMREGRLVKSGGMELLQELEKNGYQNF